MEELLRERERRFQNMLNAIPAAIDTTDADGRITFFNRTAAELSGHESQLGKDKWCVT